MQATNHSSICGLVRGARYPAIVVATLCLGTTQGLAATIIYQGVVSDRATWLASVGASVIYTETFESVPIALNTATTTFSQAGITYSTLAGGGGLVVTGPPVNYGNFGGGVDYGAGLGHVTTGVLTAGGEEHFEAVFSTPINVVAMDVLLNGRVNGGVVPTIKFFNNSTLLGTATWTTENDVRFLGFISDLAVTRFEFSSYAGSQTNTGIDNLTTGELPRSVPEPGSLALLCAGLAGFGLGRRRSSR